MISAVSSLMLATMLNTVPFLVQYQELTLTGPGGEPSGKVLLVLYIQAHEEGLDEERRPGFRDLLQRIEHRYGHGDRHKDAALEVEYLDYASLSRFGQCGEMLFQLEHFEGLRYRVCLSPDGSIVRVVEDLTTPERIFWLATAPDAEALALIHAALDPLLEKLGKANAAGDPEAAKRVEEALGEQTEILREQLEHEGRTQVHRLEVNGLWEEFPYRPGAVEKMLARFWPEVSPEFSARCALLFRFLRGLEHREFQGLCEDRACVASEPFFIPLELDLSSGELPFSLESDHETLQVTVVSALGPSQAFLALPDALAKEYYPRGKWDPPEMGLSFDERVVRLERGKGW